MIKVLQEYTKHFSSCCISNYACMYASVKVQTMIKKTFFHYKRLVVSEKAPK